MKSINKNLAMILMGVVAMSTGGVYALTQNVLTPQTSTSTGSELPTVYGHIVLVAKDKDGNIKAYRQTDNIVVNNGLNATVNDLFGTSTLVTTDGTIGKFNYVGVGTGTNAAAYNNVALQTIQSSKQLGTVTPIGESNSPALGDGMGASIAATWSAGKLNNNTGSPVSITEAGLFDTQVNSTTGTTSNMYARQQFSAISINSGDSLSVTWKITFAHS
jgi:hypothetical protein